MFYDKFRVISEMVWLSERSYKKWSVLDQVLLARRLSHQTTSTPCPTHDTNKQLKQACTTLSDAPAVKAGALTPIGSSSIPLRSPTGPPYELEVRTSASAPYDLDAEDDPSKKRQCSSLEDDTVNDGRECNAVKGKQKKLSEFQKKLAEYRARR